MGAIYFCIHNFTNPPIDIKFTQYFMNMKNRGQDDTQLIYDQGPVINHINENQMKMVLSRRELGEYKTLSFTYGFHRMSINDLTQDGSQPFEDPIICKVSQYPELRIRPKRRLLCNGEIYNYKNLVEQYNFIDKDLQSKSDVEVILPLFIKKELESKDADDPAESGLKKTIQELNGEFSFVLTENTSTFDLKRLNIFAVRDQFGTRPLYMVKYVPLPTSQTKGNIFYLFVSEIKSIPPKLFNDPEYIIQEVPPGTFWSYHNSIINKSDQEFITYYNLERYKSLDSCVINTADQTTISHIYKTIKTRLSNNVMSRWNLSEKNVGVLLSGGFDSSIILSILVKQLIDQSYKGEIHAFTIGDDTNSDVIYAKKHVESLEAHYSIDIHHHIINISDLNIILPEINDLINGLETFDPLTVHKSIPFIFLLKYIKEKTNVKVLLSGEGLDELCGHKEFANLSDKDFQSQSVDLICNLHKYDLLRSDKVAGILGLEIRYPFLDSVFIEFVLSIHPKLKRPQIYGFSKKPIEKYIVRKAFDYVDDNDPTDTYFYIDKEVLWNMRQDISECIGDLKQYLQNYYDTKYSDIEFFNYTQQLKLIYFTPLPTTKEEMYYQIVYNNNFPNTSHLLIKFWKDLWK